MFALRCINTTRFRFITGPLHNFSFPYWLVEGSTKFFAHNIKSCDKNELKFSCRAQMNLRHIMGQSVAFWARTRQELYIEMLASSFSKDPFLIRGAVRISYYFREPILE